MHDEAHADTVRQPTHVFMVTQKFGQVILIQNSSNLWMQFKDELIPFSSP